MMRPARIIKSFADLAAAVHEVRAETPSSANPPMSRAEVRDSAARFLAYRRNVASEPAPPFVKADA